jgi:diguanylate cyclase (GGDEF)-like protein
VGATGGSAAAIATNLAYPLGDLLLLSFVIGIVALTGWRPGRRWLFIAAGLAASGIADSVYLYKEATSAYTEGTGMDSLWLTGAFLVAWAAWDPPRHAAIRFEGLRLLFMPTMFALGALGLLFYGEFHPLHKLALGLAGAALLLVIVRMTVTFSENAKLLAAATHDSLTDTMTGLGNRRKLLLELSVKSENATKDNPQLFAIFDLNGFKSYNDNFGHPAGDELLGQLGRDLEAAVQPHGSAYRMGGDEFCIIASTARVKPESVVAATLAALAIEDSTFSISAACGAVIIPQEVRGVSAILTLADARMYAQKGDRSTTRYAREALVRIA